MFSQLTRLLGTKAGHEIIDEIERLAPSPPESQPLPPVPWEMHIILTDDDPLTRRMDAEHLERPPYHSPVQEQNVTALDSRRHTLYCTDAATSLVPSKRAPPVSAARVNMTYPDVWFQRLPT